MVSGVDGGTREHGGSISRVTNLMSFGRSSERWVPAIGNTPSGRKYLPARPDTSALTTQRAGPPTSISCSRPWWASPEARSRLWPRCCAGSLCARVGVARFVTGTAAPVPAGLMLLKELIEAGTPRNVIGRTYSLSEIAEDHRYAHSGHNVGNVAVVVADPAGGATRVIR